MFPHPSMSCGRCKAMFQLPYPTLQEPTKCQPRLPGEDWRIDFVCSRCGGASVCALQNIQFRVLSDGAGRDSHSRVGNFYRVQYRCDRDDCGLPIVAFVHSFYFQTDRELDRLMKKAQMGLSPHMKHPIDLEKATLTSCREVFSLY